MSLARKCLWKGVDRLQFWLIPSLKVNRGLQRVLNSAYASIYHKGRIPEIKVIGIQTITGCNYSCSICPANKSDELYGGVDKRQHRKMGREVFGKIMNDLRAMDFRGTISLFLMNEPLLDDRIVSLTTKARLINPYARLQIVTNGSLLDEKLTGELFNAGLNSLVVNDYTKDHRVIQNIRNWGGVLPRAKCRLVKRDGEELQDIRGHRMSNRAGNVPGFAIPVSPMKLFCERPFNHMHIGYNGKIVLCCHDWKFERVLGDVRVESLRDIWRGDKYAYVREKLLRQDREMEVCCKCDFDGVEPQ